MDNKITAATLLNSDPNSDAGKALNLMIANKEIVLKANRFFRMHNIFRYILGFVFVVLGLILEEFYPHWKAGYKDISMAAAIFISGWFMIGYAVLKNMADGALDLFERFQKLRAQGPPPAPVVIANKENSN